MYGERSSAPYVDMVRSLGPDLVEDILLDVTLWSEEMSVRFRVVQADAVWRITELGT